MWLTVCCSDCTVTAVWRHLTARWHCTVNIGKVATVREQLYGGFSTSQDRIYGDTLSMCIDIGYGGTWGNKGAQ